ncbi:MAG: SPOR domain-containing protein [Spirochaetaceae bacterium]|nr:SPOR domain-containing protein [Spirochaetaceae bacterium]
MEQRRILWIVAAVGLFLLVVVGFALILYSPNKNQDPIITQNQSTNDIWASTQNAIPIDPNYQTPNLQGTPLENIVALNGTQIQQGLTSQLDNPTQSGMVQQNQSQEMQTQPYLAQPVANGNNVLPSDSMALVGKQVQDVTVISGNTKVITSGSTTIDLTGLTVNSTSQPVVTQNTNTNTQTENTVVPASTKTTSTTSAKASTKTTSTTKASSTKTTAKVSSSAKTETLAPKYWIQAGSYSSKKNAEEARSALSVEKIASEIFTYTDANGNLFYRVRIGPYTTKSEAEYWQSRVALIEKFSGAKTYITDSSAKKQ